MSIPLSTKVNMFTSHLFVAAFIDLTKPGSGQILAQSI